MRKSRVSVLGFGLLEKLGYGKGHIKNLGSFETPRFLFVKRAM